LTGGGGCGITRSRSTPLGVIVAGVFAVGVLGGACGAKSTTDTATETSSASDTPTSASASVCPSGPFPATYVGAPSAMDNKDAVPAGYFVWNDSYGWHVRVTGGTTDSMPTTMGGTILSSANPSSKPVLKPDDSAGSVTTSENKITFSLKPGGSPVGFDFAVGCASSSVKFELMSVYGSPQPADGIYLGRASKAIENPFIVQRTG